MVAGDTYFSSYIGFVCVLSYKYSEKPSAMPARCRDASYGSGKYKQKSCVTAFPVRICVILHRENPVRHTGLHRFRAGHRRHPAAAAHDAVLLLAAALWVRSSPRLYAWLLSHRCFGGYIRNFRENRAIPCVPNLFHRPDVGGDALLHLRNTGRAAVGAGRLCWPWPSASRGTSSRSQRCAVISRLKKPVF